MPLRGRGVSAQRVHGSRLRERGVKNTHSWGWEYVLNGWSLGYLQYLFRASLYPYLIHYFTNRYFKRGLIRKLVMRAFSQHPLISGTLKLDPDIISVQVCAVKGRLREDFPF